jgi:hypothetical protein
MSSPCAALRAGKCHNGFPVAPICSHTDQIDYDKPRSVYSGFPGVPFCLDEVNCGRLFPENGRPEMMDAEHE